MVNYVDQRDALLWILNLHTLDQFETRLIDPLSGWLHNFCEIDLLCQNLFLKTFTVVSFEGIVTKHHSVQNISHTSRVNLGR